MATSNNSNDGDQTAAAATTQLSPLVQAQQYLVANSFKLEQAEDEVPLDDAKVDKLKKRVAKWEKTVATLQASDNSGMGNKKGEKDSEEAATQRGLSSVTEQLSSLHVGPIDTQNLSEMSVQKLLRPEVHFTFAPVGALPSAVRKLPRGLAANKQTILDLLSAQSWSAEHMTPRSPQLTQNGHFTVMKVYFSCSNEDELQSFSDEDSFQNFLEYVAGLEGGATVRLQLWDTTSKSATHTPEKRSADDRFVDPSVPDIDALVTPLCTQYAHSFREFLQPHASIFPGENLHGVRVPMFENMDGERIPCLLVDALDRFVEKSSNPIQSQVGRGKRGEAVSTGGTARPVWSNNHDVVRTLLDEKKQHGPRALIGPSGAGKTSVIFRAMVQQFGCYVEAHVNGQSSQLMQEFSAAIKADKGDQSEMKIRVHFTRLHLTLLLVLQAFKKICGRQVLPRHWTYLLISASKTYHHLYSEIHGAFVDTFLRLQDIGYLACRAKIESLKHALQCQLLFLDEAQVFTDEKLFGTVDGPTGTCQRSAFSALVGCGSCVFSGTGLKFQTLTQSIGSHLMKEEVVKLSRKKFSPLKPTDSAARTTMKQIERQQAGSGVVISVEPLQPLQVQAYANEMLPAPINSQLLLRDLAGRARVAASFVSLCLLESVVIETEDRFAEAARLIIDRWSEKMALDMDKEVNKVVNIFGEAGGRTVKSIVEALVSCALYNNGVYDGTCNEVINYVNASVCALRRDPSSGKYNAIFEERVTFEALLKLAKNWGIRNIAARPIMYHMKPFLTEPSAAGHDMELLFAVEVIVKTMNPEANRELRSLFLTEEFAAANLPGWISDNHFNIIDCRSGSLTFFEVLQKIDRGEYDQAPPTIVLPEKEAGPDFFTFFFVNSDRIPGLGQVKREKAAMGGAHLEEAIDTTDPALVYATTREKVSKDFERKRKQARALLAKMASGGCLRILVATGGITGSQRSASTASSSGCHVVQKAQLKKLMTTEAFETACPSSVENPDPVQKVLALPLRKLKMRLSELDLTLLQSCLEAENQKTKPRKGALQAFQKAIEGLQAIVGGGGAGAGEGGAEKIIGGGTAKRGASS